VIFLDETDPMSSPMKAKGVGELGICGVGAAVANAIYNATGVRVRSIRSRWTSCWITCRPQEFLT
jgi:CO/xanthine dehydrogenase Mo-binding subunit